MTHEIVLPNPKHFDVLADHRISEFTRCMRILEVYEPGVSVYIDSGELKKQVPAPVIMSNDNGRYSSFFSIDGHLFMITDTDHLYYNHAEWVKYYADNGVKAYFISNHRHSTKFIFDNCQISVYILGGKPGPHLSLEYMEHEAHSKSVTTPKDINVFFHGRFNTRVTRRHIAKIIMDNIPNCYIESCSGNFVSSEEYINRMCRSKIVWCPRSVYSKPDRECNTPTAKEFEAMCLEIMVLKPPIGTTESEERIPGVHYVEIDDHSSDLIEKIQYYLEHDDERKEIAHNGRMYYERNCTVNSRAYKFLNYALEAIDA